MEKELRKIELTIDDLEGTLDRISLVSEPAIKLDFFYFNSEKVDQSFKFKIEDDEKRIVTGPAMVPDTDILRKNPKTGEYFNVWFSRDTVRKSAEMFFKNSDINSSNLEHEYEIDGVTVFESWLVDNEFGKGGGKNFEDMIDGTWMISYKIDNEEVWESFIKTGLIRGFSIEGNFNLKFMKTEEDLLLSKINDIVNNTNDEIEIFNKLRDLLK